MALKQSRGRANNVRIRPLVGRIDVVLRCGCFVIISLSVVDVNRRRGAP
jgi:hypothetical protein